MSKIASYAELVAWKNGGPAPSADSVLALVGNLSAQLEGMLSRIPPGRDEDLAEGVTRFRTLGQLRAEGCMEEEPLSKPTPHPRQADLLGAHLAAKHSIQGLDSEDPSVRESARQELLAVCIKDLRGQGISEELKDTLDRIQHPEARFHVVHEEGKPWQGSGQGDPQ